MALPRHGEHRGGAILTPSPDERLRERLAHLPDACRALLAAIDRAKLRGGGPVPVTFEVDGLGRVRRVEVEDREFWRKR